MDYVLGLRFARDAVVYAPAVDVQSEARRGVGLRIGIDKQNLFAEYGHACRQVDGCRRFPDASFLIGQCNDFSHSEVVL